jgi:hypothetical protein
MINLCGYAAYDSIVSPGEEKLDVRVREERVVLG